MKMMIETSAYCVIMCIACYLFIGFVQMNQQVNKVQEMTDYVQDYVELHGNSTKTENNQYELETATQAEVDRKTQNMQIQCFFDYDTETQDYIYYHLKVTYCLEMPFLNIRLPHTYDGMARTPKTVQKSGEII